ncbi:MAG TPA: hypothetical protein VI894_01110 [Candidatus Nanoarchaeia archaeon]|nr:hypothetical protein [Candidatus Nanoarchaeia archaeon]
MKTKKSVMLSMDATVGAIALLVVIFAATLMFDTNVHESEMYMLRVGDDVLLMLDLQGYIQTLNNNTVYNNMTAILPNNYKMALEITNYNFTGSTFTVDRIINVSKVITNSTRVTNTRIIVETSGGDLNKYISARYWVWLK